MQAIFQEFSFVKVFLDDLLVHSEDIEANAKHLNQVFKKCKKKEYVLTLRRVILCKQKSLILA